MGSKLLIAGTLAIGVILGSLLSLVLDFRSNATDSNDEEIAKELEKLKGSSRAFVLASKRVAPSIVGIGSEYFYNMLDYWNFLRPGAKKVIQLGTGIIIDSENSYAVTNFHVVYHAAANHQKVKVTLSNGKQVSGEIKGFDQESDIAVIKIKASGLKAAPLGNSDEAEVGEWVIAVGNPFGLNHTVTTGIISAKDRYHIRGLPDVGFIQTDAAINPGNSGGALVNLKGEVIGINTAIASQTGGYMGIGFAIPINRAKQVIDNIKEHGIVRKGYLGVSTADINEELIDELNRRMPRLKLNNIDDLRERLNLKTTAGAFVVDVKGNTPAYDADILQGDLIVSVNDKHISNSDELRKAITSYKPDDEVTMGLIRDGKTLKINVKLGERPVEIPKN
jgi:S1-C subfamily serine protease